MTDKSADICLILEGTYPYVSGGVSSWVHQLIDSLAEFTFVLAVIMPKEDPERKPQYSLPGNVVGIEHIFLHDSHLPKSKAGKLENDSWQMLEEFHQCPFGGGKSRAFAKTYRTFFDPQSRGIAPAKLANAKAAWKMLRTLYRERAPEESFIDYFWSFRFMHYPIFKIMSTELPEAGIYHTVCTGYAGLLATVAKLKYNKAMILTEHGIYTRERRLEIGRADWIYEKEAHQIKVRESQSKFKELWNKMFATLSRLCYAHADSIITLFRGNQDYQSEGGADSKKMRIIPNGVNVAELQRHARKRDDNKEEFVLGFMGRVVSIKDVKTFIRACKHVADQVPNLKAYIMGSTDEEPEYYEECRKLTSFLGLQQIIEFTGRIDIFDYYPRIDLLVLTSISEAQPLVLLEANAMGIPCVATDVGACRELLYGLGEEDEKLGKSGLIAGITNAPGIARAVLKIWHSKEVQKQMAESGRQRVRRYYNREDLDNKYRDLYDQFLESGVERRKPHREAA